MEKYIVIVNWKYLVSVEANSHGGAEHRCLDLCYGIETAQAFSKADLKTEFFRDNAIQCETISFTELASKSAEYKNALDYVEECKKYMNEASAEIARMLKEVEKLRNGNQNLMQNIDQTEKELKAIL